MVAHRGVPREDDGMRGDVTPGPSGLLSAAATAAMVRNALPVYIWLTRKYGDAVRCPVTPRHTLFLFARPEHAEHVLAVNQDNYVKAFTYRPLRAMIGDGLLTADGEHWRRHRRLLQPMFSRRDVTGFGPDMTAAAQRLLGAWDKLPDGTTVTVNRQMSALTLDIIGSAVLGADLTGVAGMMGRALDVGQRIAVLATVLPIRWGPVSSKAVRTANRMIARTPEGVEDLTRRLIAEHRASTADGRASAGGLPAKAPDGRTDLLHRLLTAPEPPTEEEIAAEVTTFMLAGHETTSNALSWAFALLSAYPAARVRLEEEADTVLSGRPPGAADLKRLPWTTAVVRETLRLYPPAWTVERDALAADVVAGVPVPAGSTVAVSPYLIHRNPDVWPDPSGFDPGRFLDREPDRYTWIPFGGGRRACIGQAFAEQEAVLALASIAQRYRLELPAGGMPAAIGGITLRPAHGLAMRLRRRAA